MREREGGREGEGERRRKGGRESERWREGGREKDREREREIILLFKLLRDDYLKLNYFYYFFEYF